MVNNKIELNNGFNPGEACPFKNAKTWKFEFRKKKKAQKKTIFEFLFFSIINKLIEDKEKAPIAIGKVSTRFPTGIQIFEVYCLKNLKLIPVY